MRPVGLGQRRGAVRVHSVGAGYRHIEDMAVRTDGIRRDRMSPSVPGVFSERGNLADTRDRTPKGSGRIGTEWAFRAFISRVALGSPLLAWCEPISMVRNIGLPTTRLNRQRSSDTSLVEYRQDLDDVAGSADPILK